jgi:hypothetical protein
VVRAERQHLAGHSSSSETSSEICRSMRAIFAAMIAT